MGGTKVRAAALRHQQDEKRDVHPAAVGRAARRTAGGRDHGEQRQSDRQRQTSILRTAYLLCCVFALDIDTLQAFIASLTCSPP